MVGVDAAHPQEALLRTKGQVFGVPYPPSHSWALGNPHFRSESGGPSCCTVGVDAAPPQGALLRTTDPVFGLPYPPSHSWAVGNTLLSIRIGWAIMLCGRLRRCTFTASPAQNNRPRFLAALPSLPQLGPREPPIVDQNLVAHHAVRSASTLHLHRQPCSEQQVQFWAALPSLPQLGPRTPPIVDQNRVAHHAVRSASTLHLHIEEITKLTF